ERVALFAQADGFGATAADDVLGALRAAGLKDAARVLRVSHERDAGDVGRAVNQLAAARDRFDAVVMIAGPRPAALLIDGFRRAGMEKVLAAPSSIDAEALAAELRELSGWVEDIVVTQVVP